MTDRPDESEGPIDVHAGVPPWVEPRDHPHGEVPDRPPSRADAARRQIADDNDRLEAQAQYNQAFLAATGERAPLPLVGMSARSYWTYCAKRLQRFSDDYKNIDLVDRI